MAELGAILGAGGDAGRLSTAASVCAAHGKDESYHAAIAPDAVAWPTSTAEVSQVTAKRTVTTDSAVCKHLTGVTDDRHMETFVSLWRHLKTYNQG